MLDQPLWQFALAIVATVVCVYALLMGRFSWRRGTEKRCTACEYELTGLPETSTRCPECGADLTRRRAIAHGQRGGVRRSRMIALLLLIAVGWWWTKLVSKQDLLYAQPIALLTYDVKPDNPRAGSAKLMLLSDEIRKGRLWDWQVRGLVERAMAEQLDLSKPFNPTWRNLVETARHSGRITPELYHAYLRDSLDVEVVVKRKTVADQGMLITLRVYDLRKPGVSRDWRGATLSRLTIGGVEIDQEDIRWLTQPGWHIDSDAKFQVSLHYLPIGELRIKADINLHENFDFDLAAQKRRPVLKQVTKEVTTTLLPAGSDTVVPRHDPSMAPAMRDALKPSVQSFGPGDGVLIIDNSVPPTGVAFHVFVTDASGYRRHLPQVFALAPKRPSARLAMSLDGLALTTGEFQVLFRPSVDLAREFPDIDEAWIGEDIVFRFPPANRRGPVQPLPTTQPATKSSGD